MRTILFLIALLAFVTPCIGQDSKPASSATPTPTAAAADIGTVDIPPTSYRKVGQAEVSYFAESDTTEVRIELSPYRGQGQSVNMFFVFEGKGKDVLPPKLVTVGLALYGEKAKVQKINGFTLVFDEQSFALNDLASRRGGYDLNAKRAFMDQKGTIPFALFEKLVNSKSLKIQVGDVTFELGEKERDGLRDMLKAIKQPKDGS